MTLTGMDALARQTDCRAFVPWGRRAMNRRFSRWLLIGLLALSLPALAPSGAQAWLGGGYWRWYGWAGPLYGGFGGYPGARYVSGAGGYGGPGWGVWGCD